MESAAITGMFAGYELAPGCNWNGISMVRLLADFAEMDLSTKGSSLSRRYRRPHLTKVVELPDEGFCFPLKSEYDRVNFTLEGVRRNIPSSALALPSTIDDASNTIVRVVPAGDRWVQLGKHWMRLHAMPRHHVYPSIGGRWSRVLHTTRYSYDIQILRDGRI